MTLVGLFRPQRKEHPLRRLDRRHLMADHPLFQMCSKLPVPFSCGCPDRKDELGQWEAKYIEGDSGQGRGFPLTALTGFSLPVKIPGRIKNRPVYI